jgi:small subunit ribosomal protein S5e
VESRNLIIYSVEVKDISLTDYIQVRHAVYLPHTAGRFAKKQFKKAQMPIVERLVDRYDLEYKSPEVE